MFSVIIVAAGKSSRMKGTNKQLLMLDNDPVIIHSVKAFDKVHRVKEIIVVTSDDMESTIKNMLDNANLLKPYKITLGGDTRQQSVIKGFNLVSHECDYIAVHDGARPFISEECINSVFDDAIKFKASTCGVKCKDTIKIVKNKQIVSTPERDTLFITQTPQAFEKQLYQEGIQNAVNNNLDFTDDCQLIEAIGSKVFMSKGEYDNIKITTPEDIKTAKSIIKGCNNIMKIGHGYDVHRLVSERKLILGGVNIPYVKGLYGHSDADVLVHAIMDSLLGALALGDIGKHFPDNDDNFKNADSIKLLQKVCSIITDHGYKIGNIDSTICAQSPKLAPFIEKMRNNIAKACNTDIRNISVKATTEEHLGFTGEGLGISATAVCLILSK